MVLIISGATVHLSGIDILDGTPVLDIKPYIPDYDHPADTSAEDNSELNESQLVVGEEDLSVIENEVQEILDSSNASFSGKMNGSAHLVSPNVTPVKKTANESLETALSELNLNGSKNIEGSNMSNTTGNVCSQLDSSDSSVLGMSCNNSAFETPDKGDSSVSLNRSLEIVKDALCGSMVLDLNDSIRDPLDPLAIIHSVKEKMKIGQSRSPGNNSVMASNDSGLGGSLNATKTSTSSHGYPFGNYRSSPGYSPGTSFQFGSTPAVHHSVSSVSDCDMSFDASESLLKLRRPANPSARPDLVFGKPTSQISPGSISQNTETVSVSSISNSDDTLCSNYDDAFLSQSLDSILANQKVAVNPSFRSISPQLKGAGLGTGAVSEGGHPKRFSPVQKCQKKTSPPCPVASDLCGHSSRMSPKLRRLYSSLVSSSTNNDTPDEADESPLVPPDPHDNSSRAIPEVDPRKTNNQTNIADWISNANVKKELLVSFTQRSEKMIQMFDNASKLSPFKLRHLKSWEDLRHSIESLLKADPRSAYRRQNCQDRLYYFTVDCAHVTCWFDGNLAEVLKVQPMEFATKLLKTN
jgi:hypothetical protein